MVVAMMVSSSKQNESKTKTKRYKIVCTCCYVFPILRPSINPPKIFCSVTETRLVHACIQALQKVPSRLCTQAPLIRVRILH